MPQSYNVRTDNGFALLCLCIGKGEPVYLVELAGNLPSFDDLTVHPTINVDNLDPKCELPGLVLNQPRKVGRVDAILNNSFGMLGINSTLIVKRFVA